MQTGLAACDRLFEPGRREKIWKATLVVFYPCNPLKSHETAKGFFGKAWRETA
jgi:hypothetical protein